MRDDTVAQVRPLREAEGLIVPFRLRAEGLRLIGSLQGKEARGDNVICEEYPYYQRDAGYTATAPDEGAHRGTRKEEEVNMQSWASVARAP